MKFYRENKINPFASCLPLLAQLPVFLSLFYMLQKDLRLDICPEVNPPGTTDPQPCGDGGDASFFFIPDLTNKATGWVLVVLIVLYVGSQLVSTLLMSTTTDRTQRMIFLALPFFFVIFIINFPAGLLVYWITTNLWTIVQQAIIRKRLGPMRPPGQEGGMGLGELFRGGGRWRAPRPRPRRRAEATATRPRAAPAARRRRRRGARRSARDGADERSRGPRRGAARQGDRGARARRRPRHRGERGRDPGDARGRRPGPVHRPPRPDDRRRPAPRVQDRQPRRRPRRGGPRDGRRRRLPRAARGDAAPPGRPGRARAPRARVARWRWTP